jgi:hypothetical protein
LNIREILKTNVGPSVAPTLVRLKEWLTSIRDGRFDKRADRMMVDADLIEQVAESFIANAAGTERQLLSKSLQEALYCSIGFKTNIESEQLNKQLSRYLQVRGVSFFIRNFLSLFFFNFVRFETSDYLQTVAQSSKTFERYIDRIDNVCHETVDTVWKSFEETRRPLDLRGASELISQIEERLHGD